MSYMFQTSPSLHEQRTKLERAQMGDRLRQKIASRPDRQELVHRHILEVSMGDGLTQAPFYILLYRKA